jgi:hypothetical protein
VYAVAGAPISSLGHHEAQASGISNRQSCLTGTLSYDLTTQSYRLRCSYHEKIISEKVQHIVSKQRRTLYILNPGRTTRLVCGVPTGLRVDSSTCLTSPIPVRLHEESFTAKLQILRRGTRRQLGSRFTRDIKHCGHSQEPSALTPSADGLVDAR